MSFTVKQYPQINFGYFITQYTREFRTGYVEAAVNYFCLLCLNADLPGSLGKSQASVCHESLREFILETRDFAKLLGDIRADGARIKGVIEQRLGLIKLVDQEEFLRTITVQAAAVADDKGLITDAVLLYHLAEDYDHVIEAISRALSDAVSVELGDSALRLQPLRPRADRSGQGHHLDQEGVVEPGSSLSLTAVDDPAILAKNMIGLYNTNALYYQQIRPVNRETCGILLRMMEAKTEVEAGRWTPALDVSARRPTCSPGHSRAFPASLFTADDVFTGYQRFGYSSSASQWLRPSHSGCCASLCIIGTDCLTKYRAYNHVEHCLHRT